MTKDASDEKFSILFIVPSDYGSLLEKGVASMILERDEGGFFKRVFTVHPYATKTQNVNLNETHQLIEFGPEYPFSFLNFRGGGLLNYFLKPIPIIRKVSQLVKEEHISLIRATDPYWCGFYAWAASRVTGIPFCISIHADYDKCYGLKRREGGIPYLFKVIERFVLPRAHLILPIREHLIKKIIDRGVDRKRIRVIPHGIAISAFMCTDVEDIKNDLGIPLNKKLFSFVGRLAKENYVYDLIELAKRLSKTRNNFFLLLVGDGPERERLKKLVKEYNLSSIVKFTGFLPREKVASIRRQSFLALCLMGGLSLIEACAAGCPPISYDVEWHYELVKNGETGFLVKENNLHALTEAAKYLLDHPRQAKEMGEKARQLAMIHHRIAYTSEIKINCYKELLQLRIG
jgi:glycosyltransferase involved in cell wall biosynthesis